MTGIPPASRQPAINAPPVTLALCATLALAYVISHHIVGMDSFGAYSWLFLDTVNPWTPGLLGHAFLHAGFSHFLTNTGMLLAFGSLVERRFGAFAALAVFIVSTLAGALAFTVTIVMGGGAALLVGASGAVHGFTGAAALVLRESGVPAARRVGAVLLGFVLVLNIGIALLGDTTDWFGFRFGWQAHLGGLAAGLIIAAILLHRQKH